MCVCVCVCVCVFFSSSSIRAPLALSVAADAFSVRSDCRLDDGCADERCFGKLNVFENGRDVCSMACVVGETFEASAELSWFMSDAASRLIEADRRTIVIRRDTPEAKMCVRVMVRRRLHGNFAQLCKHAGARQQDRPRDGARLDLRGVRDYGECYQRAENVLTCACVCVWWCVGVHGNFAQLCKHAGARQRDRPR